MAMPLSTTYVTYQTIQVKTIETKPHTFLMKDNDQYFLPIWSFGLLAGFDFLYLVFPSWKQ